MHLNFLAYSYLYADGYGRTCQYMVRSLLRNGVDVQPIAYGMLDDPGFIQRAAGIDWTRLTISAMSGYSIKSTPGRQWLYTMWESDELPQDWVEKINQTAERVLVPCQWNVEVFKDAGVTRPIHIIESGIEPGEFPLVTFNGNQRPFTFMALGDRGMRKGDDLVYAAFHRAFRDIPNVHLMVKTRNSTALPIDTTLDVELPGMPPDPLNRRISFWREDVQSMADVYAQADCFVFPSRSGGWELPPREAAAMGVPVIAPRHTGMIAGIDDWAAVVIEDFKPTPARVGGNWYSCSTEAVADAMLKVYHERDAIRQKAAASAQWLRANQTWEHTAAQLIDLIKRYG